MDRTINRGGKIYPSPLKRKPSIRTLLDKTLYQVKNWLHPCPGAIAERDEFVRKLFHEFSLWEIIKFEAENIKREFGYRFGFDFGEPSSVPVTLPRDRFLAGVLTLLMAIFFSVYPPSRGEAFEMNVPKSIASVTEQFVPKPPRPINWLDGKSEPNGFKKDALTGPFEYAKVSGYTFAADEPELHLLRDEGVLVELEENEYIKFFNVTRPFVLPVVKRFVERLAIEYTAVGCGRLGVNGAARDIAYQAKFSNSHPKSVHPTGMAVDLRRETPKSTEAINCQSWLDRVLLSIEKSKRLDVTFEKHPAHYHVVVVPDAYEDFLERKKDELDPVEHWLATAMYFEGDFHESEAGRTAIAWTIANRMRSKYYPNSIIGVIADGAAGPLNDCEYSFMCDGEAENIQKHCNFQLSRAYICDAKWNEVVLLAKHLAPVIMDASKDPTNGAVLYHAKWMSPKPDWAVKRTEIWPNKEKPVVLSHGDFVPDSTKTIGNHIFGCSRFKGRDVCSHKKGLKS